MRRAEEVAEALLLKHEIVEPPVPVEQIALDENLRVVYHTLEDDVSGILLSEDGATFIAVNVKHHLNRQRFTIAHELAHAMLHQQTPTIFVDDLMVHFRAGNAATGLDPREIEANQFAATLLMPRYFLEHDLNLRPVDISDEQGVRRLARRYQVSQQALTLRLRNLDLITNWE